MREDQNFAAPNDLVMQIQPTTSDVPTASDVIATKHLRSGSSTSDRDVGTPSMPRIVVVGSLGAWDGLYDLLTAPNRSRFRLDVIGYASDPNHTTSVALLGRNASPNRFLNNPTRMWIGNPLGNGSNEIDCLHDWSDDVTCYDQLIRSSVALVLLPGQTDHYEASLRRFRVQARELDLPTCRYFPCVRSERDHDSRELRMGLVAVPTALVDTPDQLTDFIDCALRPYSAT